MSTTTDRLTKLRNLASHPATPPAEAAAARGKIADIEAKNPELKARSYSDDDVKAARARQERVIRENLNRMAREVQEAREAKIRDDFYNAATTPGFNPWEYSRRPDPDDVHFEADAQWKSYQARNKSEAASSRPDPFWGWTNPPDGQGDSGGYNHRPNAVERAYQQRVKAMSIAKVTYSKVSQELHECGLDVSPSEWEVLIRQLLQSR